MVYSQRETMSPGAKQQEPSLQNGTATLGWQKNCYFKKNVFYKFWKPVKFALLGGTKVYSDSKLKTKQDLFTFNV